jgi:Transposase DDE domain
MELEKLFCEIDDFCVIFEENFKSKVIASQKQQRQKKSQLCLSEVMTIIIYFHHSSYRNFKSYYQENLVKYHQKEFPRLGSYNRFIELMSHALMPLILYLNSRKGQITGISFIDSTSIPICHPNRAKRNKVFRGLSGWGKSSVAWYFGFKLHLIINDQGELLAFQITPGNTDDRVPVPTLTQNLWGNLFGDKGYISKKLWQELWSNNIKLITPFKKNMNNQLVDLWEKLMLRKRSLIETVNDQLKNISQIVHSRHRSVKNFMVNLLAGLIAYTFQEKKPSLKLDKNEIENLPALLV